VRQGCIFNRGNIPDPQPQINTFCKNLCPTPKNRSKNLKNEEKPALAEHNLRDSSIPLITLTSGLVKNRIDIKNRNLFIAANNFGILIKTCPRTSGESNPELSQRPYPESLRKPFLLSQCPRLSSDWDFI
jgi:hypothetical protein